MLLFSDGMLFDLDVYWALVRCWNYSKYARSDVEWNGMDSSLRKPYPFRLRVPHQRWPHSVWEKTSWRLWELGGGGTWCLPKCSQSFPLLKFRFLSLPTCLVQWPHVSSPQLSLLLSKSYNIHVTRPSQSFLPVLSVSCFKHPLDRLGALFDLFHYFQCLAQRKPCWAVM